AGTEGNDWIEGGRGADIIFGDGGIDTLKGGADNDFIFGNDGKDVLEGDAGQVVLNTSTVTAEFSDLRTIDPSIGNDDIITGGLDGDYIFGGLGSDIIGNLNPAADDQGAGDSGDDVIFGDNGHVLFT